MAYSFGTVTAEMAYKGHRIETTESPINGRTVGRILRRRKDNPEFAIRWKQT